MVFENDGRSSQSGSRNASMDASAFLSKSPSQVNSFGSSGIRAAGLFNPKPEATAGIELDRPHVAPTIASGFGLNDSAHELL